MKKELSGGCKVFDRPGSAAWLERHVLTHGGSKPFRCIVNGCSQRFASQSMLERHVNHHFNPPAPGKKTDSSVKTPRRSGRRAQLDQHPYSARIFDFCDPSAMERLRYQLVSADSALDRLPAIASRSVQLTARVTARRTLTTNKPEVLVHWEPADVVEDEWIPAHAFRSTRRVPCSQLPVGVWERLARAVGQPPTRRKRKTS
ncbi:zinc finger protein jing homolog [Pollicipes pollicipes]|uniref:zinc finger protein jing homolog n=1 Tax=Pollicipes pollicipes TaxID=41117 RepID=UPI0018858932|nr:zinc finger protein jing homolog [Pollicipes pollicipes]